MKPMHGGPALVLALGKPKSEEDADSPSTEGAEDGALRDIFRDFMSALESKDEDAAFDAFASAVKRCVAQTLEDDKDGGY